MDVRLGRFYITAFNDIIVKVIGFFVLGDNTWVLFEVEHPEKMALELPTPMALNEFMETFIEL